MKKYILLLIGLIFSFYSQAQQNGCDGSRFIDDVFTDIKVTKDLKYGEGTTIFNNFKELYLDVYEPENDELERRPVIILAFGGSYIGGERGDLEFLCEAYARKGYVAVTIDYRLFDGPLIPFPTAAQMKEVVIKSVSDMKAAIRYMRQDSDTDNKFRVNPDMIIIGGVSAGSITAFHTAVIDSHDDLEQDIIELLEENGGIEGNTSDNYEYSSDVQALVNFSGGLNDASWIDEDDPPFVSIHDDMDGIVPYGSGFATVFGFPIIYMEGSGRCKEVADSAGVVNILKTIENSEGHVSYFTTVEGIIESINYSALFTAEIVCKDTPTNTEIANNLDELMVYPNPTSGIISISETSNIELRLELYNILGRKLSTFTNTGSVDLSNYSNGIYLLQMTDLNSESKKTVKVILEK